MIKIFEDDSPIILDDNSYDARKAKYDEYLDNHISGVLKSWFTIGHDLAITDTDMTIEEIQELEDEIENHDQSKYSPEEYEAYLNWFYPIDGDESNRNEDEFNRAWSHHQRENPHHYQHFILVKDDGDTIFLDMPEKDIVHMLCDWHSFSAQDPSSTAYDWYSKNQDRMKLSDNTKEFIDRVIDNFRVPLTEISSDNIDESLTEALELSRAQLSGDGEGCDISINGTTYTYQSDEFTPMELVRKFNGIYKYSHGKALQWIKRHADYIGKGKPLAVVDNAV